MVVGESDHLHNRTKLNDVQEKLRSRVPVGYVSNIFKQINIYFNICAYILFYYIIRIRVLVAKI